MKKLALLSFTFILSGFVVAQNKLAIVVNFDFNKYDLTAQTISTLDSLISVISKGEIISIGLSGYCDSKGTDTYNDALSLKRVNTVKEFIENKKALPASLITANGFGEHNLLNSEVTEEQAHQNRRVEIIVMIKEPKKEEPVVQLKKENKSLTTIIEDTAVKIGTTITLQNLHFENSSAILIPVSWPTLYELLDVMKKNPKMKINIEGHICCVPPTPGKPFTEWQNYNISVLRAKMVYDYLISKGIEKERMSYEAFGSSRPVYPIPEKTEEERIANRRVELRIIDK